jgi:ribulose-phosphate 3-epimerase
MVAEAILRGEARRSAGGAGRQGPFPHDHAGDEGWIGMRDTAAQSLRKRCLGISAGIFAADAGKLREAALAVASWGGTILHFDVIDGVFAPAITGGPGFVKALATGLARDVHLMVDKPSRHVATFADAGADIITVQAEAADAADALKSVRSASDRLQRPILAGLALMPGTSVESAAPLLALKPDLIFVLSVDPRSKTPPEIAPAVEKLAVVAKRTAAWAPLLGFDGGVTAATIAAVSDCRPDIVVSGSAIFGAPDPAQAFRHLAAACEGARAAGRTADA